ncbi:hypothetical protein T02_4809 [Trichinella nativa]|uniref:Uncharacterized protein n=1 Tax=Trichinella nativa TaxID=6335 RepID=A0A0V1KNH8_9BILA|nr:hypothetical protein T02_4809 [Trichinella nativa]
MLLPQQFEIFKCFLFPPICRSQDSSFSLRSLENKISLYERTCAKTLWSRSIIFMLIVICIFCAQANFLQHCVIPFRFSAFLNPSAMSFVFKTSDFGNFLWKLMMPYGMILFYTSCLLCKSFKIKDYKYFHPNLILRCTSVASHRDETESQFVLSNSRPCDDIYSRKTYANAHMKRSKRLSNCCINQK